MGDRPHGEVAGRQYSAVNRCLSGRPVGLGTAPRWYPESDKRNSSHGWVLSFTEWAQAICHWWRRLRKGGFETRPYEDHAIGPGRQNAGV